MRSALVLALGALFLITALAVPGIVIPRANAQETRPEPLPGPGTAVRIDADDHAAGLRLALMRASVRVGDPDSAAFEENCTVSGPLQATVLGSFEGVIVARYTSTSRPYPGSCPNGRYILLDRAAWTALTQVEARLARERAARERRRGVVRRIIRSGSGG